MQIKTIDDFKEYIDNRKLIDLGLLKDTAYAFKEVPGFGHNTNKVLVYTHSYDKDDLWRAKLERERMIEVLTACKPLIINKMQELYNSNNNQYKVLKDMLREIDEWEK